MAVFSLFLRNVLLQIEILKIKIPEHSDPPSQHFFVHKAFRHSFFCRGKVVLCHPAEWHKMNPKTKDEWRHASVDRHVPGDEIGTNGDNPRAGGGRNLHVWTGRDIRVSRSSSDG